MELFEAIHARRSVRRFLPESVPRGDLEKIVRAGIEAPSGCNLQLRQYVIVDDPAVMEKLRALSRAMNGAPAAIVLLVKPEGTKFGDFWVQDASAAMENMLLAAVDLGYAGCWIEGALRRCEDQLREILAIPQDLRAWSLTPIGRPAESPQRPPKSDFNEEVVHDNVFGG